MGIFKDYDVRGIYPDELDEEKAYRIGRAFVVFTGATNVVVGRDARKSAPEISKAFIEGITDQGANAVDAGMVTSPMLYYLSGKHDEFNGGVMVTASHNPPQYIGFKMCYDNAKFINKRKGSADIEKLMLENDFAEMPKGTVTEHDFSDEYADFIAKSAKEDLSGMKLIIDTANGCVGPIIEKISDKLGLEVKKLFFEPDGDFPNHAPNPLLPESQTAAKEALASGDYPLAALIDADGDRIVFLDETGRMIKSVTTSAIWVKYYYDKYERKPVAFDVLNYRPSAINTMASLGVEAVPSPVGYSNVKDAMIAANGMFGCEFSSHFQHEEVESCDNSALSLVKLLTCIARTGKTLKELGDEFETMVLQQVNYEVENKDKKIKLVDETFSDATETLHIDGVSKTYPDYWFNVRKSNTEPLLRVTVEAETSNKVEEILEKIRVLIGAEDGERYA